MPARFCEPFDRGRLRREIGAQRIARRRGEAEAVDRDVEVEIVDARAILHRVDDAQRRLDAEHAEVLDVGQVVRLEGRLVDQEFDGERARRSAVTRLPSLSVQPASVSSCGALRSSARSCPEPSVTGGT